MQSDGGTTEDNENIEDDHGDANENDGDEGDVDEQQLRVTTTTTTKYRSVEISSARS